MAECDMTIKLDFATPTEDVVRRIEALSKAVTAIPEQSRVQKDKIIGYLEKLCEVAAKLQGITIESRGV